MALFGRFRKGGKKKSILPGEVDAYYKSEAREKKSVAILLGLATLIGTLLFAALIFFGGRAIYRSFNSNDNKKDTAQTEKKDDTAQQQQGVSPSEPQSTNNQNNQGATNLQGSSNTGTSTPPRIVPNPSNTPALGDEPASTTLPRTGDEGL